LTEIELEKIEEDINYLSSKVKNTMFDDLFSICARHFPEYRHADGSHIIFKTKWAGDPRINIQRDKNKKMAKPYQVKQVIKALEKLKQM